MGKTPQNVLFITADQWRGECLSVLGHPIVKTPHLDALAAVPGLQLPRVCPERTSVWHLFVVQHQQREQLQEALRQAGIGTGLHYPLPLHLQPAYAHLGYGPGAFPVSEQAAQQCLSLPMYPTLTDPQLAAVASRTLGWCRQFAERQPKTSKAA